MRAYLQSTTVSDWRAMERGAWKPRELAAGTAVLRSAGLRPASSGGFQPSGSVVLPSDAPKQKREGF